MTQLFFRKTRQILCLLFLVTALTAFGQVGAPWEKIESLEGNFRLQMPGAATTKVDSITTAMGKVAYHVYFFQEPDNTADNLFYMLSYADYPDSTFHPDSTELLHEFWTTTADAAADAVDGELIYQTPENWFEHPGYRWRIQYLEDRAVVKTHAFLVEDRYYALQTISLRERTINPSTDRFFNSFRLLAQPKD